MIIFFFSFAYSRLLIKLAGFFFFLSHIYRKKEERKQRATAEKTADSFFSPQRNGVIGLDWVMFLSALFSFLVL